MGQVPEPEARCPVPASAAALPLWSVCPAPRAFMPARPFGLPHPAPSQLAASARPVPAPPPLPASSFHLVISPPSAAITPSATPPAADVEAAAAAAMLLL